MAARFNRHVPALCAVCTKPLSVRERRATESGEMLCAWDRNDHMRAALEKLSADSYWISEPASEEFAEEAVAQVIQVDPAELFGFRTE